MTRVLVIVAVAATAAWSGSAAPGPQKAATKQVPEKTVTKPAPEKAVSREVVIPAGQMAFKEAAAGVLKSALWGDPTKGAYATITKFARGTRNALHTHTHDIKVVVISGTFVYNSGSGDQRLGPGSYVFEPGGMKHTSGAGLDSDCLFFEESDGAFDLKPAK
ncbi:MAG TPA: DUF4437 domain-containing protein [Thermoanaerobaculia bacterium]|nr:DUF4437 domain-containing protein [Thermoanaerobaculia bacterium]